MKLQETKKLIWILNRCHGGRLNIRSMISTERGSVEINKTDVQRFEVKANAT